MNNNIETIKLKDPKIEGLNIKQTKFLEEYIISGNATQAYKLAYGSNLSDNVAAVNASNLLKNPKFRREMLKKRREIADKFDISIGEIKQVVADIMLEKSSKNSDKLKAAELLGKMAGAFIDHSQVDVNGAVTLELTPDKKEWSE